MATGTEVMQHLRSNQGWSIVGNDFNSIIYDDGVIPLTKKEFDDTFAIIDKLLADQDEAKATARQVILDRLGLTAEEAQLLLGGN